MLDAFISSSTSARMEGLGLLRSPRCTGPERLRLAICPGLRLPSRPADVVTIVAVRCGRDGAGGTGIAPLQFFTRRALLFVADAFTALPVAAHAAGYANAVWMLTFGVQVALGLLFVLLGHVSLRASCSEPGTRLPGRSPAPASP